MALRLLIASIILMVSCTDRKPSDRGTFNPDKSQMEEVNRYLVQKDRERIENYIERKGLKMTMTSSGLWYSIVNQGIGSRLTDNAVVSMEYRCSLLDGTECYSSAKNGPKRITIGKSNIESGLDQGLRMLARGGEAVFIIPSFLAHGLIGDGAAIPGMSVIVYEVKILNIE